MLPARNLGRVCGYKQVNGNRRKACPARSGKKEAAVGVWVSAKGEE